MRRAFGEDSRVTYRKHRYNVSSSVAANYNNTLSIASFHRTPANSRGENAQSACSVSNRPSLQRNAEERRRRILEIRKRFDSQVQQQKVSPNRCTDLGRSKARSSKLKRPTLSAATSTPAAPSTTLHTTSSTSKSGASGKATNAVRMGGVMSSSSRTKSAVRKQLRETGASMARRLSSSARRSSPSQSLATSSTAQSLNGRDRDRNGNHRRRDDTQTQSEVVVLREDNHSTNNNATTAATKTTLKNNSECNEPAEKRTHLVSVDDSSLEASHLDACEEKEADDRERSELREKYISAKRGSSVLSAQVSSYAERVDSLKNELEQSRKRETQLHVQIDHLSNLLKQKAVDEYERNELQTKDENKENIVLRNLVQENERLRLRINGLLSEKEALRVSLQKANEEIDRLKEELLKLNSTIEVEREEWDRMQSDLLIAVRVANDFKLEAQEEMKTLYAKIADLQKRRQSNLANMSSGSIKLFDERSTCWEDIAWERLMRGCERGSRRNALLRWCQQSISPSYPNIELTNFSSCWTDGKALCYLLANFYPEKINAKIISSLSAEECIKLALDVGMRIGVEVQLSADSILCDERPDWSLVMSYVLNIYYLVSS